MPPDFLCMLWACGRHMLYDKVSLLINLFCQSHLLKACQECPLDGASLTGNYVLRNCGCCLRDHCTAAVYLHEGMNRYSLFPNAVYTTRGKVLSFLSPVKLTLSVMVEPAVAPWKGAGACPSAWQVQYTMLHALLMTSLLSLSGEYCSYSTALVSSEQSLYLSSQSHLP